MYGYQNAKPQQSENLSEATRQKSSKMPSSSGKNLTSMNFLTKEELSAVTWFASQGCSGLRENFSRGALKAEFRRLSKKLHPDTNYGKSPSARAFYELMQSVKILEELALKLDA
ncbi:MAG: hypothetical protein COT74_02670 [Bdellovibrionales bacterium CG10_big_fil_rev_8_21_14_0_10_45_34]|nr:MAG: hypothetical protein COT74_02670 [Bdellovibrionales bacterium CG10_big_fil_rev_8_21_14_0_10_45_34]